MCTKEIYENAIFIKENDTYSIYDKGKIVSRFYNDNAKTLYDCFENEYKNCVAILYFEDENWQAVQVMHDDGTLILLAKF